MKDEDGEKESLNPREEGEIFIEKFNPASTTLDQAALPCWIDGYECIQFTLGNLLSDCFRYQLWSS
jgi:hypothetical protein